MNNSNNQPCYSQHKKRGHCNSFDSEIPPLGLPRKKFVSEESFAKDMAAMSLNPENTSLVQQQNLESHAYFNTTIHGGSESFVNFSPEDEEEEEDQQHYMALDANGRPLIGVDQNGLPIEIRPGENKPRIPQFVLENPELLDPRDKLAYQNIMKSLSSKRNKHTHIEVLNNPSEHYAPISMDID